MPDARSGRTRVLDHGSWGQFLKAPGRAQVCLLLGSNSWREGSGQSYSQCPHLPRYNLQRSFEVQTSLWAEGIATAAASEVLILRSLGKNIATGVPHTVSPERLLNPVGYLGWSISLHLRILLRVFL